MKPKNQECYDAILELLEEHDASLVEISRELGLDSGSVSNYLKYLLKEEKIFRHGAVKTRGAYYSLDRKSTKKRGSVQHSTPAPAVELPDMPRLMLQWLGYVPQGLVHV